MRTTLEMKALKEITLSPAAYLKLREAAPQTIKRAVMIPPRIGKDKHFGKMRVTLSTVSYEAVR